MQEILCLKHQFSLTTVAVMRGAAAVTFLRERAPRRLLDSAGSEP
jgi:hypothetical protein